MRKMRRREIKDHEFDFRRDCQRAHHPHQRVGAVGILEGQETHCVVRLRNQKFLQYFGCATAERIAVNILVEVKMDSRAENVVIGDETGGPEELRVPLRVILYCYFSARFYIGKGFKLKSLLFRNILETGIKIKF